MKIAAIVLGAALAGCTIGTTFSRARSEPTYAYRGADPSGERPDRDADILARGQQPLADPSRVTFLEQAAAPPGAQILGRLAYSNGKRERKEELIARVKAVAAAAGGDAAVGTFLFADSRDPSRAEGVEAVILRLAPKVEVEPPPTPAKPDASD